MKQYFTAAGLLLLLIAGTLPGLAQEPAQEDRLAQLEQRMAETKARLNLTDEQVVLIEPIIESSIEATLLVLEENGIDLENRAAQGERERPSFRQMRAIGKDLKKVRAEALDELGEVLDDEQLSEYKKIQEERRAKMRARIQERRKQ